MDQRPRHRGRAAHEPHRAAHAAGECTHQMPSLCPQSMQLGLADVGWTPPTAPRVPRNATPDRSRRTGLSARYQRGGAFLGEPGRDIFPAARLPRPRSAAVNAKHNPPAIPSHTAARSARHGLPPVSACRTFGTAISTITNAMTATITLTTPLNPGALASQRCGTDGRAWRSGGGGSSGRSLDGARDAAGATQGWHVGPATRRTPTGKRHRISTPEERLRRFRANGALPCVGEQHTAVRA